jgi:hypothetical protein
MMHASGTLRSTLKYKNYVNSFVVLMSHSKIHFHYLYFIQYLLFRNLLLHHLFIFNFTIMSQKITTESNTATVHLQDINCDLVAAIDMSKYTM